MAARPDGGVAVFDVMNRRLELFDESLMPRAPDALQGVSYFGGGMAYAGSFLVLPTADYTESGDGRSRPEILSAVSPTDTVEIVRYEREVGGQITLESCGMFLSGIEPIFAPRLRWAVGSGSVVAVAGTGGYEVDVYRGPDFAVERRIRRSLPPVESTEALAQNSVGDATRVMTPAGERVCDPEEVVRKRGFAPTVPPISSIALSPEGEIFVRRWAPKGEDGPVDVLNADGEYLGTLAPGFPVPSAFLGQDRIVVREEDEMELASVVVYRIKR